MIDPRRIRLFHIFRYLPWIFFETRIPILSHLASTYYSAGTLLLHYVFRNRHIFLILEKINLNEKFVSRVVERKKININEPIKLNENTITKVAELKKYKETEQISTNDKIKTETAQRSYGWIHEEIGLSEIIHIIGSSRYTGTKLEEIDVVENFNYKTYDRKIITITETLKPIELIYPAKIYPRYWWLFTDKIYVLDGIFGGYPSPEYPGKMQYFRIITEKVFSIELLTKEKISAVKKEEEEDKVSISDVLNYHVIYYKKEEIDETVNLVESFTHYVYKYIKETPQETIDVLESFQYVWGIPIEQSFEKKVSNISIEHEQVIDYVAQEFIKYPSVIYLEHEQVVNYVDQSMTKEVAGIELEPLSYYY